LSIETLPADTGRILPVRAVSAGQPLTLYAVHRLVDGTYVAGAAVTWSATAGLSAPLMPSSAGTFMAGGNAQQVTVTALDQAGFTAQQVVEVVPFDVSNLVLWLHPQSVSVQTGRVCRWVNIMDVTTGASDAVQPTDDSCPLPAVDGTRPVVALDGNNDFLSLPDTLLVGDGTYAVGTVARRGDNAQNMVLGGNSGTEFNNFHLGWRGDNSVNPTRIGFSHWGSDCWLAGIRFVQGESGKLLYAEDLSGSRNFYEDGTAQSCGSDATVLATNPGFSVGRWVDEAGTQYFRGAVGEVFIFDTPLNAAQRGAYFGWMDARWAQP
jgi:hypothetical protein